MTPALKAPFAGTLIPLEEVADPVFSQGLVGPGFALKPRDGEDVDVFSPIAGKVAKIHPHAFVVSDGMINVLVHLGLDTVTLKGEGFTLFAEQGDSVDAGQLLIRWSPRAVRAAGMDTTCPIVFLDSTGNVETLIDLQTDVEAGDVVARLSPTN
ncbi:MAG: PTS glucose transporter subunit IIA [Actinomycetaceae bacterium]|nr:PTS glucose transporter subunit IIA [Actinomycetaceae bacterium]